MYYQKSLWKSHPKKDIIIENIFGIYLFGIAGYLIVIALPTKEEGVHKKGFSVENNTIYKHEDKNEYIGNFPKFDFSDEDGLKQCPNCGTCHDSAYEVCPACKYTYNK